MISPKQPVAATQRDWFPYYAGYTEEFVGRVFDDYLSGATRILDPWSGSGTTTSAAVKRGLYSLGVDINPVLTLIARARLTPRVEATILEEQAREVVRMAKKLNSASGASSLLRVWMRSESASFVDALCAAIYKSNHPSQGTFDSRVLLYEVDELPQRATFFYCALFLAVRQLVDRFRSTNPTWLKSDISPRKRIAPSWKTLELCFLQGVSYLSERLTHGPESGLGSRSSLKTGSATDLPIESGSFDAVLTSPPYATRIDYVKGTLPELALLGADSTYVSRLRGLSTGTPVISAAAKDRSENIHSEYGVSILRDIEKHPSKGSARYYYPWMKAYLTGLQLGLIEAGRAVRKGGTICIVVQDSYYKELRVDLQRIVVDIMSNAGRLLCHREDFRAANLKSRMNPRARAHALKRSNTETLLVFSD